MSLDNLTKGLDAHTQSIKLLLGVVQQTRVEIAELKKEVEKLKLRRPISLFAPKIGKG